MQAALQADRAVSRAPRAKTARRPGSGDRAWLAALVALPIAATVWGLPYYAESVAQQARNPLHPLLRPSGWIGQSFGLASLLLFLFLWLYPLRKKLRWLSFTGTVGDWLRVHTAVGIALPLVAAVHASWHFRGLIGLGYAAMVLVWASGLVGRYLYVRIPRTKSGVELSRDEASGQRRTLVTEIAAALEMDPAAVEEALGAALARAGGRRAGGVLRRLLAEDFVRWRALRELRHEWRAPRPEATGIEAATIDQALRLARREIALAQHLKILEGTQRLLRYWHVAHRPVAVTALLAVLIHVGAAVILGQTWLR